MSKRTQLGSVVTTTTSGQYYLVFMLDVIFIWLATVKKPLRIARASSSYEHGTCRLHLKRQCSMYEKPESSGPDMTMLYNESPPFLSTPNATGTIHTINRLQISHPQWIRRRQFLRVNRNTNQIDHCLVRRQICTARLASNATRPLHNQI